MPSKEDIINASLLLLGDIPTNTIGSDASSNVKTCVSLYNLFYPVLMGDYAWRFAMTFRQLSLAVGAPMLPKWKYVYFLPEDYLYISHLEPRQDYEIYGIYLYTNVSNTDPNNLPTLFFTKIVEENILPSYYVGYLTESMGALFAKNITNDDNLAAQLQQSSMQRKRDAKSLDSQSQTPRRLRRGKVYLAQYGDTVGSNNAFGYPWNNL